MQNSRKYTALKGSGGSLWGLRGKRLLEGILQQYDTGTMSLRAVILARLRE